MDIARALESRSDFITVREVPRKRAFFSEAQDQTKDSFSFKWKKRDTFESPHFQEMVKAWLKDRYSSSKFNLANEIKGKRVMDAGCGAGHSAILFFGDLLKTCDYLGVDISDAVDVAKQRFAERGFPGNFLQTSLTEIPDELGTFDVIFSEGVLHHTDNTRVSFLKLAERLAPGGHFLFYVYKQKAPVREFTDDLVREKIASLSNEDAWKALMPLSQLGKKLGDLKQEIHIDEDIDVLGIPSGSYDLQRLFYWFFCKAFYRTDWSLEEMNHINFDWFRPKNCFRHTPDEVKSWLKEAKLETLEFKVEEAGITVICKRA